MFFINAGCLLWEIVSFFIQLFKQAISQATGSKSHGHVFKKALINYKPSFLAALVHQLLSKLFIINMFWVWLPHFQKLELFTVNLQWYSWAYGYICWEFSSWIFHFSCHRVRFLWCLHSPHHAPSELNMTVNWVHFFAEGYYSSFIHLTVLCLLGVNPAMFLAFISIDSAWGIFIHVSERALSNGKLGILHHLIITPSHHRTHHAKNPLYVDTNFANVAPMWDWIFGTLQPLKDEVKTDYGITRDLDVTNFMDLYFGDIILLFQDVKNANGIKNKLFYLIMPPGWVPGSAAKTASVVRKEFLRTNPELGVTSKNRILAMLKPDYKVDNLKVKEL